MARATLIAHSSPSSPAQEEAFNDWYTKIHVPQVREAIPSITEVSRYRTVDPTGQSDEIRYIAVYEIDLEDVAIAAAQLGAAGQSGAMDMDDAIDLSVNPPVVFWGQAV
jgi:hypothetical protein